MAFGGYKFKGYKVVRANLATNTYANWCLLVHQARIKAFMESCALSGAQWHFSKTNGALSFEDYGNVIYRVANANGDYHDYLSFFKYGDEELYYMIATLGEYYQTSTVGSPVISANALYQVQGGNTTTAKYKIAGYSSALSLTEFPDDGPFSLSAYPFSALPCTSQIAANGLNYYNNGVKEGTSTDMVSSFTTIYVGYATKGKDIITVTNRNKGSVESGDGFSSLCAPDDNFKLMKINFGHTTETTDFSAAKTISLDAWSNECLTSTGARNCAYTSDIIDYNCLAVVPSALPFIQSGGQHVPYGSIYLSTLDRSMSQINGDYMQIKGVVKNELVCSNSFTYGTRTQQPGIGTPVMGGNLMCFCCCQKTPTANDSTSQAIDHLSGGYQVPGGTGSGFSNPYPQMYVYPAVYVGWDPSNPNINDGTSWPELALQ